MRLTPFLSISVACVICSTSTLKLKLNQAQTQSQKTNKFLFSQVELKAFFFFFKVKREWVFLFPTKLPYQWHAAHWCVYFKLSRPWNAAMFLSFSVCGSSYVQRFYGSVCMSLLCSYLRWLTMSECVTCCVDGKEVAVGLEAGMLLLFALPLYFSCPVIAWPSS